MTRGAGGFCHLGNSIPLYAYNDITAGVCRPGNVLRCKSPATLHRGAGRVPPVRRLRDCLTGQCEQHVGRDLAAPLLHDGDRDSTTTVSREPGGQGGGVYVTAGQFYDCVFQDNMTLGDLSAGAPNWYFSNAATVLSNCWMEVAAEKTKSTDCRIGRVVFADPDNGDWSRQPFAFYRSSKTQVVGKETIFRAVVRDEVDDTVAFAEGRRRECPIIPTIMNLPSSSVRR